jgi:hypothetical protein
LVPSTMARPAQDVSRRRTKGGYHPSDLIH